VSKLTLVRSKTDNVLVIKHKQPAAAAGAAAGSSPQHRGRAGGPSPQGRCRSRAGRALKPKRPRLDAAERAATKDEQVRVRGGDDDDDDDEKDVQCKIVKVILENCKTPTTGTTTAAAAPQETVVSSSSASPSATPAVHGSTSAAGEVTVAPRAASGARPVPPAASEPPRSIAPSTGLVVPVAPIQKTPIDAVATAAGGGVLATSLRASTPLNGVVGALPLAAALAHPVHALQLLGAPVRHLPPPPPPGAARWSVPLVNGAGAWLALQPVATASAPPPATGFLPGGPAPPRPDPAAAVVVGPARAPVAHSSSSSSSSSVISSPIKQFLEHASRSVPPLAQHAGGDSHDDRPTDLSMKTLRRLEVRARCLLLSYQSAFIHLWFIYYAIIYYYHHYYYLLCLRCFDAVGWAAGRASGL